MCSSYIYAVIAELLKAFEASCRLAASSECTILNYPCDCAGKNGMAVAAAAAAAAATGTGPGESSSLDIPPHVTCLADVS